MWFSNVPGHGRSRSHPPLILILFIVSAAKAGPSSGLYNTGVGNDALKLNATGSYNTAVGNETLLENINGNSNNAFGNFALTVAKSASFNNAFGTEALEIDASGMENNAFGFEALLNDHSGSGNTAVGHKALLNNNGSNNTAIGWDAGQHLTTGSNNIDIGTGGVSGESNVMRLGDKTLQTATYVAGVANSPMSGATVVVNSEGRLGVLSSSERFKTKIHAMSKAETVKLRALRPVTFHLKADPQGALQYGLIAEEVAMVYPDLVIRDADGKIQGVRYDELAPMLLNEVEAQNKQLTAQGAEIDSQLARLEAQAKELDELRRQQRVLQTQLAEVVQFRLSLQ